MPVARLDRGTFVRPIAHRGLHDVDAGVLENSAPAFEAAIAAGFGIECDVRAAADGLPVVFHDPYCSRLLARGDKIAELTAQEIATLAYPDGSPVLPLGAFLNLIAGRVPVLVELKGDWKACDQIFAEEVASHSAAYPGPLALMSFEPAIIGEMARRAPSIPRGLVATSSDRYKHPLRHFEQGAANSLARIDAFDEVAASFVAFDVDGLPTEATERLRQDGVPVFAWTVRNDRQLQAAKDHADAPIFEGLITGRSLAGFAQVRKAGRWS